IRMKNTVKARAVSRAVSGGRDRVRASSVSRSGAPGTPSRRARHARRSSSTARKVSSPASRPTTRPSVAASQRTSWRSGASWGRATGGGSGTVAATWVVVMAMIVSHDRGNRGAAQGETRDVIAGDSAPPRRGHFQSDRQAFSPLQIGSPLGTLPKLVSGPTNTTQVIAVLTLPIVAHHPSAVRLMRTGRLPRVRCRPYGGSGAVVGRPEAATNADSTAT